MDPRDINAVVNAHAKELMRDPNVVGVYVGVMDDAKTPCIKVMLAKQDRESESRIPRQIENFPVIIEITGAIRPLRN